MCDATSPTIQNCKFNVSGMGVFCRNSASPNIENNQFIDSYIRVTSSSEPVIKNNIIVKNYHYGITIDNSNPTIINNTIAFNGVFGIQCINNSNPVIVNNIITNNGQYGIQCGQGSSPEFSYNLVSFNGDNYYDCEPGTGDIYGVVFFADPENDNYHIKEYSSSIDMGNPDYDFSNEPEPNGGRINMGAYGNTPEAAVSASSYSGPKYVDCNIEASGDGSSPENAFKSIKEAMYIAGPGDTIYLAHGTYTSTPDDPIYIKSGITLLGEDKSTTIIAVEARDSAALEINGENIILKKITIKGLLSTGCEMHCYDCSIEITDCYFENVEVNVENSSHSIIHNNTFYDSPLYIYSSDLTIKNNLFNSEGIYLYYSSPEIINNTIINSRNAGIRMVRPSFPLIKNNIVAGSGGISCYNEYGVSEPILQYNNLWKNGSSNYYGCVPGAYDISVPPSFINEANDDYHLQKTSQCVDAGDPSSDFSNEPAPNGGRINLGAYGNTAEAQNSPTVKEAEEWYVDASVSNSGHGTSWNTAFKTITEAIDMAKPGNSIFVASGVYYEKLIIYKPSLNLIGTNSENTIINGEDYQWSNGENIGVHIIEDNFQMNGFTIKNSGKSIVLEGASGAKLQDLKIWGGEAYHIYYSIEIINASNSTIEKCEISESICIESESSNIIIKDNVLKYSDTINPYTSSNAINIRSGNGFVIESNSILGYERSAGISLSEVSNATISNNSILESDDGIFIGSDCDNIKITGNITTGGIGFGSASAGIIANNLIFDTYSSYDAGISVYSSSPEIYNNTIYNFFPAGIECSGQSSPEIINNIIFKTDHSNAYGILVSDGSNPVIKNNNIAPLMSGMGSLYSGIENQTGISGNISDNMDRTCDFNLRESSTCIDKGDNSVNLASLDINYDVYGNRRVIDGDNDNSSVIDIGAVEFVNNDEDIIDFSLQVGDQWTYNGSSEGRNYKVVKKVIEFDNTILTEPAFVVETRIDGVSVLKSWYKSVDGKLIVLRNQSETDEGEHYIENYQQGLIELWYPPNETKQKLSLSDVRIGTMNLGIQSYIALNSLGLDTISLENGTAEGYKVVTRWTKWGAGDEYISDYTQWIIPYVGVVKYKGDDYVEELVSFSLKNGTITESSDADNDGIKDYLEIGIYKTDWDGNSSTNEGSSSSNNGDTASGGGGGGSGIFGNITLSELTGYHFDWTAKDGKAVYMPVTDWIKALKGAQTHVEGFAPGLANFIRGRFDALERKAKSDQDGFLSKTGTYLFPVFGRIAEMYLDVVDSHELMDKAYADTTISVDDFNNLTKQGTAVSSHVIKEESN